VNTLAVLAHVLPAAQARAVLEKTISDPLLAHSSIYFLAYTNGALREVGLGDRYLEMLGPWRDMLNQGLTTWAEEAKPDTRSDCHAWGASPNFELLRTVAGIDSMAPGFKEVRIAPNLGKLPGLDATMPHPNGPIHVLLKRRRNDKLDAEITLPRDVTGEFVWQEQPHALKPGLNRLRL
jgi:hypothetical protein